MKWQKKRKKKANNKALQCRPSKVEYEKQSPYLIRFFSKLRLDKTQKMFLIHASRMMHVCINFSNIIKVTVWCTLLIQKLLISIH